ncbi:dynamin family protein [Virgibacillus sediminis]|uniref:Dynamin family protein n=1 Tax=Virgibacillus sediminis TaxID=202260 RepID=A0ABV7A1V0_9BACI
MLPVKDGIKSVMTLEHLVALHKLMEKHEDAVNAQKIAELYEKLQKEELVISFAGHFSAGKSSMINYLLGADILPKSPIPTSANVVKLSSGNGTARVYFRHQEPMEYKEPYDMEMIKRYSKDKDAIERIEISTAEQLMPEGVSVVDTPGIDAADDADRVMTESSLHLVDVLFYVMDYNHVQSEVNLHFLHSLQQKGIPYYVIINQVDKHDEGEIPFRKFHGSVTDTFNQWELQPAKIFYSSLMDPDAVHNEVLKVKAEINHLMEEKDSFFQIDQSVKQVVEDHKRELMNRYEELVPASDEDDGEAEDMQMLKAKWEELRQLADQLEEDFQQEMQQTLKNAYLMPADLRETARLFLESQKSDFKIGFFASKKKTNEERKARAEAFIETLNKNAETAVQWKLRDKFSKIMKDYGIIDPQIDQKTQSLSVSYSSEDAVKLINPGAKVNGDYVLNYTKEVATDIKSKYKQEVLRLLPLLKEAVEDRNKKEMQDLEQKINKLENKKQIQEEQNKLKRNLDMQLESLEKQQKFPEIEENDWKQIERNLSSNQILRQQEEFSEPAEPSQETRNRTPLQQETDKKVNAVHQVLQDIEQAIDTISDLPGFQGHMDDLQGKYSRLSNRSFTIALFGAFSAGKSSFANALLGENALPVSPNPTTAAVNRICPINEDHPHGSVAVKIKDKDAIKKDLLLMTRNFQPNEDHEAEELLEWIRKEGIHRDNRLDSMYQSYLSAMLSGYDYIKVRIGRQINITMDEFADYVTDETKACYIESIDLYFDSSLTRQGITLVDTPGADSVNARHTNVAFDYIKHADAILYVTYYNHALSRADKDFLMQLGRVKEAFEMDKMFFIVNAADLAADKEELQLVTEYVEQQLIELGIRFPRLYPVSSKRSLKEKQSGAKLNTEMLDFEKRFHQFIGEDLQRLTIQSATSDLQHAYRTLQRYVKSLNLNEQEKENHKKRLLSNKDLIDKEIDKWETSVHEGKIAQKIEKQMYYVLERLSIRFHDMFKETFNPTTITESGKKAQEQLKQSLRNLLDYTGHELLQEVQAVSLRVESLMRTLESETHSTLSEKIEEVDDAFFLQEPAQQDFETPLYDQAFKNLSPADFRHVLSAYKGTKAFFVKNEKEIMKDRLYQELETHAQQYIEENRVRMESHYQAAWRDRVDQLKHSAKENAEQQLNNHLEMINAPVDLKSLEKKEEILQEISKRNK